MVQLKQKLERLYNGSASAAAAAASTAACVCAKTSEGEGPTDFASAKSKRILPFQLVKRILYQLYMCTACYVHERK